ncbi:hypothetical protein N4G70_17375 [Streptomyces sp. ASQP_92]|uniref:hypothetical protein n=1 Tax=Streptomyces sp. ASQP_92 TaxID=2979116 RepID=UPI0021C0CED8|nr:hypothetical protein [Streptomyces sp. ASQP_92]MCT9090613.1 hypothetical protein [Streptomyces sp. ASQP_92]
MKTRQGAATVTAVVSLCVAWIMAVVTVVVPGEQNLLLWAGIVLATGAVPALVLTLRRRAESAADKAYRLGLGHGGPDLLKVYPPQQRGDGSP